MTGIKFAEVRKTKAIVPITSERKSNHVRKSTSHVSDFKLDGLVGRDSGISQLKSCLERMVQADHRASSNGIGTPSSSSNNIQTSNSQLATSSDLPFLAFPPRINLSFMILPNPFKLVN